MKKRLECKIYGRVQMVMFRDFTRRNAVKLALVGTVQNLDDGSVYVVSEGEEKNLRKLLKLLKKGPIFAKVKEVKEYWVEPIGGLSGFNIVY